MNYWVIMADGSASGPFTKSAAVRERKLLIDLGMSPKDVKVIEQGTGANAPKEIS